MYAKLVLLTINYTFLFILSSCSTVSTNTVKSSKTDKKIDQLYVYSDGSMKFNDRFVNSEDVIIYPDGFGGEKAAVKMSVPLHPDFYRDSIYVKRKDELPER